MPWWLIKIVLPALGALALVFVVVAHFKHDAKVERQRDEWKSSSERWEASSKGWERAHKAEHDAREAERTDARKAAQGAQDTCQVRVDAARRSASSIRRLIERPIAVDPATNCPARAVLGADVLREALRPNR